MNLHINTVVFFNTEYHFVFVQFLDFSSSMHDHYHFSNCYHFVNGIFRKLIRYFQLHCINDF